MRIFLLLTEKCVVLEKLQSGFVQVDVVAVIGKAPFSMMKMDFYCVMLVAIEEEIGIFFIA